MNARCPNVLLKPGLLLARAPRRPIRLSYTTPAAYFW